MVRKRADYRPRIADAELTELLAASGAVLVEGARAVGKTATAMQASASHVLLDVDLDARRMMSIDPAAVLTGDPPHPSPLPSSPNTSPSAAGQPTSAVPRRRPCASTGAIRTRSDVPTSHASPAGARAPDLDRDVEHQHQIGPLPK